MKGFKPAKNNFMYSPLIIIHKNWVVNLSYSSIFCEPA